MADKTRTERSVSIKLPPRFVDTKWLRRLLALEKERRGVPQSSLVFVGMHNLSQFWWCGIYTVLKSRKNEVQFFSSYLHDRFHAAISLGSLLSIPTKLVDILAVGEDLTNKELGALHPKTKLKVRPILRRKKSSSLQSNVNLAPSGDSMLDGVITELALAERYPSYRWNFPFSRYVVVGAPDGITREFVYEFKATRSRHFLNFNKPVALTQADLYGYFFGRPKKRVQIYVRDEDKIETIVARVDPARAVDTLARFENADRNSYAHPPVKWKCLQCELQYHCPISQK
jgi:hypothetical protein